MTEVTRGFCWHQNFVPCGCLSLTWGYLHLLNHERMSIKSEVATNVHSDEAFLLTSNFSPNGLSATAQGLCTCINAWKNVYKIRKQRQNVSFWNWYKMMGMIKALKCCQNLYQLAVHVCPCPGDFFKWWPCVDLDHFYDRVKFVPDASVAYWALSALVFPSLF